MEEKYSDDVLNMQFNVEVIDGLKPEKTFFAITEDTLRDVYHVDPSDSLEVARRKVMEVVSKDDFLYKYFHKDPRIWEIKAFEPGYWTTPAKVERALTKEEVEKLGYDEEEMEKMKFPVKGVEVVQTFQQKLTIKFAKRNLDNIFSDERFFELYDEEFKKFLASDNVFTAILKNKCALSQPNTKTRQKYDSSKLLVIPDVELHIGKLASKFDSTDSYDYKKALYRYIKIILEAEKVQQKYKAKEICMTIGNDFFNTDTEQNTTTAGTEQHNDTRFQQMITNGIAAHIWAVERMKKNCDKLIIKFNPGNHDYLTDYTLFMQLCYLYRNDPKVQIESKVKDSRWATGLVWNNNLIIFAHGKTPEGKALNDDKLSLLRDTMFKEEAKGVDYTTVLAGHLHNATENNYSTKKTTSNGVTVLRNGSPAGDGAWDSGNLYRSDKSHQVYLFDANKGLYASVNIKLTKEDLERSITMQSITDETDYLRSVEKSIGIKTEDILNEELRRLNNENEKQIKLLEKKYLSMLNKIETILSKTTKEPLSVEQRNEILTALGYEKELKPYLETRSMIYDKMSENNKKAQLTKKIN